MHHLTYLSLDLATLKFGIQNSKPMPSSLHTLNYEPAFEQLGEDYYDIVTAAQFPAQILRFRNNDLLPLMGLEPQQITDEDFTVAFAQFQVRSPLMAMRYHGYQFGEYNSRLGDGRGFLYAQVRGLDGELYDFGTKGSGTTPYSRGGDGRLTLKGGVREVLAAEMLHRLGVQTSRCLSLVETGESLWRGDEPSPTRSSVMVRFSRSHIRFGTFERLHFLGRKDLIQTLLDHVLTYYYPHLMQLQPGDRYSQFYGELVQRVATLAAQWLSVGFCHAVLNTDNMSITGESFDYGPYAFIQTYDPKFTAAYFDYYGRYAYANQPEACLWNLEALQVPLKSAIAQTEMERSLGQFYPQFRQVYLQRMSRKLGFEVQLQSSPTGEVPESMATELLRLTLQLLYDSKADYHDFFRQLRSQFTPNWRTQEQTILVTFTTPDENSRSLFEAWRSLYFKLLQSLPEVEMAAIAQRLIDHNPLTVIVRPEIEAVWQPIVEQDDWQPFNQLLERIRQ
jgi:serine/tyrosine/threonine adenylyltransferase